MSGFWAVSARQMTEPDSRSFGTVCSRPNPVKVCFELRTLQTLEHLQAHGALRKWEHQIACTIPADVWQMTWIPYRLAAENTFLWQLLYRIPATNKWRFPNFPVMNPDTWCPGAGSTYRKMHSTASGIVLPPEAAGRGALLLFPGYLLGNQGECNSTQHMCSLDRHDGNHQVACGSLYARSYVGLFGRTEMSMYSMEN